MDNKDEANIGISYFHLSELINLLVKNKTNYEYNLDYLGFDICLYFKKQSLFKILFTTNKENETYEMYGLLVCDKFYNCESFSPIKEDPLILSFEVKSKDLDNSKINIIELAFNNGKITYENKITE